MKKDIPVWANVLWGGRDYVDLADESDFMLVWKDGWIYLHAEGENSSDCYFCTEQAILENPSESEVLDLMRLLGIPVEAI